jgi:succinate-semialdehyde dehydrogenase/glutarate-semialdehyde dehydrogenase
MSSDRLDLSLFIAGEWLNGTGRKSEPLLDPSTGDVIGELPHASKDDLDKAIDAANEAYPKWRATSALERSRILKKASDLMRERQEDIARKLTLEEGKTLGESRLEVAVSADFFEWFAEEGKRAYGRLVPPRTPGWRQTMVKEPVGVCALFSPWNFPAVTPARKVAAALAAGCTCILKPSEETPATALAIARCLHDAGLPKGVLNVVFGVPSEVSSHLIASPVIRKVSFTGSVPVGKQLAAMAAQAGAKRTTMELGGHAPVLIFDDVDAAQVGTMAAAGKLRNAGQICVSPTRFYVHERIHDRFVETFVEQAKAMKVGSGLDPESKMGPLANPRRVEAMEAFVADAVDKGAKVRTGGNRIGNRGYFWEPTILTDVPDDARILHEEPFGALAAIMPFRDESEVLDRANALPFGLAAYTFTRDADRVARVADKLETGLVGVNTFVVSLPETPFGGVKESGYGSEGGAEGLDAYHVTKFVMHANLPS